MLDTHGILAATVLNKETENAGPKWLLLQHKVCWVPWSQSILSATIYITGLFHWITWSGGTEQWLSPLNSFAEKQDSKETQEKHECVTVNDQIVLIIQLDS